MESSSVLFHFVLYYCRCAKISIVYLIYFIVKQKRFYQIGFFGGVRGQQRPIGFRKGGILPVFCRQNTTKSSHTRSYSKRSYLQPYE